MGTRSDNSENRRNRLNHKHSRGGHERRPAQPDDPARESGAGNGLSARELDEALNRLRDTESEAGSEETGARLAAPIGYVRKHGGLPPAKKSLGQNWLADPDVSREIASALGAGARDLVVEVGPGGGALTGALLATGAEIVALEIDSRMVETLADRWGDEDRLSVLHEDALRADLRAITGGRPYLLAGNLPYHITSSLLFKLLDEFRTRPGSVRRVVIIVQYEVARRLAAGPGDSEAGILSVLLRFWCEPELVQKVSRESFRPPPNVDAGVLKLDVSERPIHPVTHWPTVVRLVKGTFAKRRKMLRNSVPAIPHLRPIEGVEFDWSRRPQTLSAAEFAWLAEQLAPGNER
ncbi:MAG: Ribosomal RNA small subunit methyltransferase A [Calditrichaeota bacterium]|nr:Ribosomal RNA small subunit methyltransferase A [Calditrichota bacterium]